MFIDQNLFYVQIINEDDQMHIMECCGSHTYIDDCNCLECVFVMFENFVWSLLIIFMYFNSI